MVKNYPGKRPQTVWRGGRIMYGNVDDDDDGGDDDDGDDDSMILMMMMTTKMKMRMICGRWSGGWKGGGLWCREGGRWWCWGGRPIPRRDPHFVRACAVEMHRATLYRNLQVKCRRPEWAQNADTHFVWARVVEMHVNISEEPLYTGIHR